MLFDKQLIFFDAEVANQTKVLSSLADQLIASGVVKPEFKAGVLQREAEFPTGLKTEVGGVAIPHTDADKVNRAQVAFMRLKTPVIFHQMGDNAEIPVKLIFMLALKNAKDQPKMLATLMGLFRDPKALTQLETVTEAPDFLKIMKQNGISV